MRRNIFVLLGLLLLVCLVIGAIWTARLDIPSPKPWWYGKPVVVRVEVWEPGHDLATFAMSMPKGPMDAMYAMGLKVRIELDHGREIELRRIWKQLQRLPKGERLKLEEDDATVYFSIEEKAGGGS
jgi:hypothetical protein